MFEQLKYTCVLLLVFILAPCGASVTAGVQPHPVHKAFIEKNDGPDCNKKNVNRSQDEDPQLHRKYKSKCTEVAVLHIPHFNFVRHCKFNDYSVPLDEKPSTVIPYLFSPKRGPPAC